MARRSVGVGPWRRDGFQGAERRPPGLVDEDRVTGRQRPAAVRGALAGGVGAVRVAEHLRVAGGSGQGATGKGRSQGDEHEQASSRHPRRSVRGPDGRHKGRADAVPNVNRWVEVALLESSTTRT